MPVTGRAIFPELVREAYGRFGSSTSMFFTPCYEGISHNRKEDIELARSVPGANLLLNAAVARANR